MKKHALILFAALLMVSAHVKAEETNTLFFLHNAPMRHQINPAFQNVSDGYVMFIPALGHSSLWVGNNSLTVSDVLFQDKTTGRVITPLHPNADRQQFFNAIRNSWLIGVNSSNSLLGFGFRIKDFGYVNVNMMLRVESGLTLPHDLFSTLFGGGIALDGATDMDLKPLGFQLQMYNEVGLGYSHKINPQWTVGGKVKFLMGMLTLGMRNDQLSLNAGVDQWHLAGKTTLSLGAPLEYQNLPKDFNPETIANTDWSSLVNIDPDNIVHSIASLIAPNGYGAAFDLGATYKPIDMLEISLSVTDLGFIYWHRGRSMTFAMDTTFAGVGDFEYSDYVINGQFRTDSLLGTTMSTLSGLGSALRQTASKDGFCQMVSAKINVGVQANFLNNILSAGLISRTRFFNGRAYEELTIGGTVRPCNWFNFALTYSLIDNAKGSSIGTGLSIMPYDGINLTLAADYVPLSFARMHIDEEKQITLPYKYKGLNLAFGISIVWGTNKEKEKTDTDTGLTEKPITTEDEVAPADTEEPQVESEPVIEDEEIRRLESTI